MKITIDSDIFVSYQEINVFERKINKRYIC